MFRANGKDSPVDDWFQASWPECTNLPVLTALRLLAGSVHRAGRFRKLLLPAVSTESRRLSNRYPPPPRQQPRGQRPPAPQKNQQNPFENVPQAPEAQQPEPQQTPGGEAATPGSHRLRPSSSAASAAFRKILLRALILSRKGDVFSEEAIHRDFMALWNTGRFDDLTR